MAPTTGAAVEPKPSRFSLADEPPPANSGGHVAPPSSGGDLFSDMSSGASRFGNGSSRPKPAPVSYSTALQASRGTPVP